MADSNSRWEQAVAKLIALTKEGSVEWHKPQTFKAAHDDIVGVPYLTRWGSKDIAIYEFRYKQYSPDFDEFYWANGVAIMFYDVVNGPEWQWPSVPGAWALLDAVRYRASGGDEFLEEVMKS